MGEFTASSPGWKSAGESYEGSILRDLLSIQGKCKEYA